MLERKSFAFAAGSVAAVQLCRNRGRMDVGLPRGCLAILLLCFLWWKGFGGHIMRFSMARAIGAVEVKAWRDVGYPRYEGMQGMHL